MSADNQLKLAQQIKTVSALLQLPFCTYNAFTIVDSLQKLCAYLDAAGTTDIRNLSHYRGNGLDFFFDIATGYMYPNAMGGQSTTGTPGFATLGPVGDANSGQFVSSVSTLAASASNCFATIGNGRYGYGFYCEFTPDDFPVFVCEVQDIGTPWLAYRAGLEFIGSTVVGAFIGPIAQSIGGAVLGADTAAAYPALSQAVGNAAVNTALNGGDVKSGVVGAIGGSAGLQVGVQVSSVTCDAIGAAAAAATTALINGQSIIAAGLTSLIKSGITAAVVVAQSPAAQPDLPNPGVPAMDPTLIDTSTLTLSTGFDPNALNPTFTPVSDPNVDPSTSLPSVLNTAPNPFDFSSVPGNPLSPPASMSVTTSTVANQDPLSAAAGGIITALAAGAVKALLPSLGVTVPVASQTVNANGTITTRNGNGTVSTAQIPPGAAYPLPSGGVVTNNGNGTYTTVLPNGTSTTTSYTAARALSSNTLLYVGAAVLAVVLMGKR